MTDDRSPAIPTIRAASPADMAAVGRLGAALIAQHHAFDPDRFFAAEANTAAGYAAYLDTQLARPDVVVIVAEAGPSIAGYAYAAMEGQDYMALRGPAGMLYDLVVDPGYRRQGMGRLLLEATRAALIARGAPRLILSTAARNEPAQRFFARAGFRQTMIEMTSELTPPDAVPTPA